MNKKGAMATSILVFLPACFAFVSMITQFEIIDLMYLIVVFILVVRYYISKKKA